MAVADSERLQLMVATLTYTGIKQLGAPPYKCPGEGVNSVCCLIGVISASSAEANDPNEHPHTWRWRRRGAQLNGWVRSDPGVVTDWTD